MYVLWHVQMIWLHQRGKSMFHKHSKNSTYIKAPLLISLGRIFIINYSNHDKKMFSAFSDICLQVATDWKITYFWLDALKKQLLIKLFNTFLLSKETHGQALRYLYQYLYLYLSVLVQPTVIVIIPNILHWMLLFFPLVKKVHHYFVESWYQALFPNLSFLPCEFLVINTGIGSNSSSATLSEPSGTSKPEMRLLSSAA